jgi:hypothetical protein
VGCKMVIQCVIRTNDERCNSKRRDHVEWPRKGLSRISPSG